jgi:anti-anti-sigma factor
MPEMLDFRREGDCLWITPTAGFARLAVVPELTELRAEIERGTVRLIVDLSELSHFGSMMLDFLVVLWRLVGRREGRLVIYKPSAIGREVLAAARLDQLWPIADTRDEALRLAREPEPAGGSAR